MWKEKHSIFAVTFSFKKFTKICNIRVCYLKSKNKFVNVRCCREYELYDYLQGHYISHIRYTEYSLIFLKKCTQLINFTMQTRKSPCMTVRGISTAVSLTFLLGEGIHALSGVVPLSWLGTWGPGTRDWEYLSEQTHVQKTLSSPSQETFHLLCSSI